MTKTNRILLVAAYVAASLQATHPVSADPLNDTQNLCGPRWLENLIQVTQSVLPNRVLIALSAMQARLEVGSRGQSAQCQDNNFWGLKSLGGKAYATHEAGPDGKLHATREKFGVYPTPHAGVVRYRDNLGHIHPKVVRAANNDDLLGAIAALRPWATDQNYSKKVLKNYPAVARAMAYAGIDPPPLFLAQQAFSLVLAKKKKYAAAHFHPDYWSKLAPKVNFGEVARQINATVGPTEVVRGASVMGFIYGGAAAEP